MAETVTWESEPIGAHVDPYDGTSPVRISPEEQGEELEVLEEEQFDEHGNLTHTSAYKEAETGEGLLTVGGRKWIEEREEMALLERFNKLVAPADNTYGLVNYSFGPEEMVTDIPTLKRKFHQAVVEVYTLRQNRLKIKFPPHAGETSDWTQDVKLKLSATGDVVLTNAQDKDVEQFLNSVKELDVTSTRLAEDSLVEEADGSVTVPKEAVALKAQAVQGSGTSAPGTTAESTKKPTSKPFDFMSNRPVPRTGPQEPIVDLKDTVQAAEVQTQTPKSPEATTGKAPAEIPISHSNDLSAATKASDISFTEQASPSTNVSESGVETKYRNIPLTNPFVKFPIAKRLLQLTGHRISDPILNASNTLADLLRAIITASDPRPAKLKDIIDHESKLRRIRSKDNKDKAVGKQQPHINLSSLPNVKFSEKRVSWVQKEQEVGRWKVIEYALTERGLPVLKKDLKDKTRL